ncbi:heme-binding domain-containing protein [Sphingobacterium sp. MYb382]|uniref:heme-binding domain-containing protein n=1 Tax=Sphingobacterium sp. MYb382 TaxID=2745278 RepID=UPI0030A4E904
MNLKRSKTRACLVFLLLSLTCITLQFFHTSVERKPVTGEPTEVPEDVAFILKRSCYNCHSNEQNLSFFDKIAPVSWLVNKDIERAREVMNFSEWDKLSAAERMGKFYAIYNMVEARKMPLPAYRAFHQEAQLSAAEIQRLKAYALSLTAHQAPAPAYASSQPLIATHASLDTTTHVPLSPNGIAYDEAFKTWKVIGMTVLFDQSIRIVYANDILVKAIDEENFHPWPKGSTVAKAVWKQTTNADGEIVPGEFVNVQYMTKDDQTFPTTEGWGFAKFSGDKLKPTGKTALFAQQSCIGCHRQLAAPTGFLFNVPPKVNAKKAIAHYLK